MPTYEYRCRECGEQLEAVQAFTDDPLTDCPACGGPLRKLFGSVGISFKGSGFYRNDSRSKATSSASSSNGDKDKASTSTSEPSTASPSSTSPSSDSSSGSGSKDSSSTAAAASA
jgi:putative FmdB family regulatory protein